MIERNWVTGSEDFSYYGLKAPSVFLNLGGMPKGNDPQKAPAHHTADFFIDESGMKTGIKAFCNIVFDYLNMSCNQQSIFSNQEANLRMKKLFLLSFCLHGIAFLFGQKVIVSFKINLKKQYEDSTAI